MWFLRGLIRNIFWSARIIFLERIEIVLVEVGVRLLLCKFIHVAVCEGYPRVVTNIALKEFIFEGSNLTAFDFSTCFVGFFIDILMFTF